MFVLDPKLQNGQKLPKWNHRSRLGQFLGFLDEQSSLVALVQNLITNYVSPQYHLVFDDLFQTVFSSGPLDSMTDAICSNLFDTNRDFYFEDEFDSDGNIVYHTPPLDEVWLDEFEQRDRKERLCHQKDITEQREHARCADLRSAPPLPPCAPVLPSIVNDDDSSLPCTPMLPSIESDIDDFVPPVLHQEGDISPDPDPEPVRENHGWA